MAAANSNVKIRLREAGEEVEQFLASADDDALGYVTNVQSVTIQKNTMYVHEIAAHLAWHLMHPKLRAHTPIYLGSSAIGKTDSIREGARQAAHAMGRDFRLEEFHLANMGPTDIAGIPRPETRTIEVEGNLVEVPTGRTRFLPPARLPIVAANPEHELAVRRFDARYAVTGRPDWSILKDHPLNVLFFDEVTNPSMPSVIHSCFSIWYGRFIAEHALQPDTGVVLAGNRTQDGTNSINLPRSATTRLDVIEVVPSLSGWYQHFALKSERIGVEWDEKLVDADGTPIPTAWEERPRIHPLVIAYLNKNAGQFAPDASKLATMQPHPSPRTWAYTSEALYASEDAGRILDMAIPEKLLWNTIAGHIGQNVAADFRAHCKYAAELPDARKLLNSPGQGKDEKGQVAYGWLPQRWPDKIDMQMIVATQMVPLVNKENARRFMRFMMDTKYFSPDTAGMTMKLIKPRGILGDLAHQWAPDEFAKWAEVFRPMMI